VREEEEEGSEKGQFRSFEKKETKRTFKTSTSAFPCFTSSASSPSFPPPMYPKLANTPSTPSNTSSRLLGSVKSPLTTLRRPASTALEWRASRDWAREEEGEVEIARTMKEEGEERRAETTPEPWWPVEPMTAMVGDMTGGSEGR
jgi:hypothetical protein